MSNLLSSQRTTFKKDEAADKKWILIDAKGQILGRLASRIAYRIRGKHRTDFSPHQDLGDYVVVINAKDMVITGDKDMQKEYRHHTGYKGHLKSMIYRDAMKKDPTFVLTKAVKRMLPSGPLGRKQLANLRVYAGPDHEHKSQKPESIEINYK
jgi:large subunit ribosomal protein L13